MDKIHEEIAKIRDEFLLALEKEMTEHENRILELEEAHKKKVNEVNARFAQMLFTPMIKENKDSKPVTTKRKSSRSLQMLTPLITQGKIKNPEQVHISSPEYTLKGELHIENGRVFILAEDGSRCDTANQFAMIHKGKTKLVKEKNAFICIIITRLGKSIGDVLNTE